MSLRIPRTLVEAKEQLDDIIKAKSEQVAKDMGGFIDRLYTSRQEHLKRLQPCKFEEQEIARQRGSH